MKRKIRSALLWLGNKTKLLVVLLIVMLTIIFALIFSNLNRVGRNIEQGQLSDTVEKVEGALLKSDIHLMPDMAYLTRIKPLFYTSLPEGNEIQYTDMINSAKIIKNIIQKGIYFYSGIISIYILLEDAVAPYVLVNGDLRLKHSIEDAAWIQSCFSMNSEYYFDWRTVNIPFAGEIEVFSVYRKIVSVNWESGEITDGYIVINYDRKTIADQIKEIFGHDERSINLFNENTKQILSIGKNAMRRETVEQMITDSRLRGDFAHGGGGYGDYSDKTVYTGQIRNSPLYYVITQDSIPLNRFLEDLRHNLLLILTIVTVIILALYLYTYFQAEKMFRTEKELLYARTQLNSHFLLNTMDYIYWKNVHDYGVENEESAMIENFCSILKYTLDSSGTMTTLREEISCAKLYLKMQAIRKEIRLEAEWNITDEALEVMTEKLIAQTILENSIQHGMPAGGKALKIQVKSVIDGKYLYLYFEDSGRGMGKKEMAAMNELFRDIGKEQSGHIGLANINRRVKLQYGNEYGLSMSRSEMGGLCVALKLPFGKDKYSESKNRLIKYKE